MSILRLDLHVHTIYSKDSLIQPQDLIKQAEKRNLDGLAICDHDTLKGWNIIKKSFKKEEFLLIPGMEIETELGEIIALFITNEIKGKKKNFFEVIDLIKQDDGLIIIPHPFDFLRSNRLKINQFDDISLKKCIDGIEIMNSRIIFPWCINKAKEFNKKFHFFETGGSDAHTLAEVGNAFTLMKKDSIFSEDEIRKALISRKSRSGGFLSSPIVHFKTVINKFLKGLYF